MNKEEDWLIQSIYIQKTLKTFARLYLNKAGPKHAKYHRNLDLFLGRFYDQKTFRELGEEFGVTAGTARAKYEYVRRCFLCYLSSGIVR